MGEGQRVFLDLAIDGLKAEIGRIEQYRDGLTADDRRELEAARSRLDSILEQRKAAA